MARRRERTWQVAVETVFRDVHVKTAQVHGAKVIYGMINAMELEFVVGVSTGGNEHLQSRENPSIYESEILASGLVTRVVVMQVCKQDAKSVSIRR